MELLVNKNSLTTRLNREVAGGEKKPDLLGFQNLVGLLGETDDCKHAGVVEMQCIASLRVI